MKTTKPTTTKTPSPRQSCNAAAAGTLFCSMSDIGAHIHRAGIWPRIPARSTIYKWRGAGLIVTRSGWRGTTVVDVPATLAKLKNPFV